MNDITIYKTSHFIYDFNKNENIKKSLKIFILKMNNHLKNLIMLY